MKTKLQRIALSCPDETKHSKSLAGLYEILHKINPQKTKDDFRAYYFAHQPPEIINIVFIMIKKVVVGFYSVTAYTYRAGKTTFKVLRTAIGLLEQLRGQKNTPTNKLCKEFILYKIRHPFTNVMRVFFIENPLVYSMVAKRVKNLYPNRSLYEPETIRQIRSSVLQVHAPSEMKNSLVLRIYFKVFFTEADLRRICESQDRNLQFYVSINPGYAEGDSVLTILPITWQNIGFCLWFTVCEKSRKLYIKLCRMIP